MVHSSYIWRLEQSYGQNLTFAISLGEIVSVSV